MANMGTLWYLWRRTDLTNLFLVYSWSVIMRIVFISFLIGCVFGAKLREFFFYLKYSSSLSLCKIFAFLLQVIITHLNMKCSLFFFHYQTHCIILEVFEHDIFEVTRGS